MEKAPEKKWYMVDGKGKNLGRLASRLAQVLMGKHKPTFVPHEVGDDFIIVTNAEKIVVTGNNKEKDKKYYRHSQYPGGLAAVSLKEMREKHPDRIITLAVKGMLPNNKLRDRRLKKLKVYTGDAHPHKAQKPEVLTV